MKRIALLSFLLLLLALASRAAGVAPVDTVMHYTINYHWGFIQKTAGSGVASLKSKGDTIAGTLVGQSIPWGGRIYSVADTLVSTFSMSDGVISQNVLYANGWYRKPLVADSASVAASDNPQFYKTILGKGQLEADSSTIEAVTIMTDMIGYLYIARIMDFSAMTTGQVVTIPVNQKSDPEKRLKITYMGLSQFNGRPAWEMVINYTYDGTYSAYPVTTYVDTATRAPLSIAADLIIGHVEMVLDK